MMGKGTGARLVGAVMLAMCVVATQAAEVPRVALDNTEHRAISSKATGQRYELLISLPEGYATSGKAYPTLYVLDGWHFPLMAFLQDNSRFSEKMPPVITVNISQGVGEAAMARRGIDFSPTRQANVPGSGGAAAFLKFMAEELIPYVERTYRTVPSDRGLLGHSMGGLFAIYALEERPELFRRIVAASPSLDCDGDLLIQRARAGLKALPSPVRLDLSTGTDHDYLRETRALARVLEDLKPANLTFRITEFPGENHNSVRLASFPNGLYWVYAEK
jgi:predicted alpha/beta superfamily hydrolase